MNIRDIDHITITVSDIARSERFYHEVFDMPILENAEHPGVMAGKQRIYFVLSDNQPKFHADKPTTGAIDICVIAKDPMDSIVNHLKSYFVPILEGPSKKEAAHGEVTSIIIQDPDKNLIEVANY